MRYLLALILSLALYVPASADTPVESHGSVPTAVSSGVGTAIPGPDKFANVAISSATTTNIITNASTTLSIRINAWVLQTTASASNNFTLEYGTGATCTGSPVTIAQFYGASSTIATINYYVPGGAVIVPPGNNVCIITPGTAPIVNGLLSYTVY